MEDKLIKKIDEQLEQLINEGININNVEYVCKLSKIKHMTKEDQNMYSSYGRTPGFNSYGNDYGRRGYDMKYRGEEYLERMHGEYGRYNDMRGRYGHSEETDKSFHYMISSLEDFIKVLYEEADSQQQKQLLRETLQRSMM